MPDRPNILLITADGMRYDALNCNGNMLAVSPRLDAFAGEGVRFSRAYCSQPICMPCRASIMTGRFPHAHGVWQNGVPLDSSLINLPTLLGELGYSTTKIGKCHFTPWLDSLNPNEGGHHVEYRGDGPYFGFERVRVTDHSPQDRYFEWLRERFPQHVELALNPRREKPADATVGWKGSLPAEATKSAYTADLTITALQHRDKSRPFFLWSSFIDPHHPYNPSPPFCDMFDHANFPKPPQNDGPPPSLPPSYHHWARRLAEHWGHVDTATRDWLRVRRMYQGKVAMVDHFIGQVLDTVRQEGLWDNTLIMFLSDHGTMLGDYGLMQVGEYSQECLIRVPMMCKPPATEQRRGESDALVSVVDILPTLLDYAGGESPLGVQGLSLRDVLEDPGSAIRESLMVENRWGQAPPEGFHTLITPRYKLSVQTDGIHGELYDLHEDPREMHNRFQNPDLRQVQTDLLHQFAAEMLRIEDPLPRRVACW